MKVKCFNTSISNIKLGQCYQGWWDLKHSLFCWNSYKVQIWKKQCEYKSHILVINLILKINIIVIKNSNEK